ncbi:MAG TPA: hypothetical protein VND91_08245 [Candidatus Saccharimonadia bacterium]|nr:hypothetical protein [Candidatus Saccharimonadia bacterium]
MNEQAKTPKVERKLDRAVEATFPASDPVALGQGVTPAVADYSRRRPPRKR